MERLAVNNTAAPTHTHQCQAPPTSRSCLFCNEPSHFLRECLKVEEFINDGRCKKNIEGKIVLPSGTFVPNSIQGSSLANRIDKWHAQNPGQKAQVTQPATGLLFESTGVMSYDVPARIEEDVEEEVREAEIERLFGVLANEMAKWSTRVPACRRQPPQQNRNDMPIPVLSAPAAAPKVVMPIATDHSTSAGASATPYASHSTRAKTDSPSNQQSHRHLGKVPQPSAV
jgi:hypothetical protein